MGVPPPIPANEAADEMDSECTHIDYVPLILHFLCLKENKTLTSIQQLTLH